MKTGMKKLRKRILKSSNVSVEKIDTTRFFKTKMIKRSLLAASVKREISLSFEVRDMFRELSGINLRNTVETKELSKIPVVDRITPVQKTVIVPTAYDVVQDAVLGTFRKGKQFVQTQVEKLEVLPVIDWEHFSYPILHNIEN